MLSPAETQNLEKRAEAIWSFLVRSKKRCARCGATSVTVDDFDADHIVGRAASVKFDLENGICLCIACHRFRKHGSYKSGKGYNEWFDERFPGIREELLRRKKALRTSASIQTILSDLQQEVLNRKLEEEWKHHLVRHPYIDSLFAVQISS